MKKHPEISNPFALAHWMAQEGYHPHDGLHADVLDAAHEMYCAAGHEDGAAYANAGGKPDETAQPDEYENEVHELAVAGEESEMYDDDEKLLDDSETAPGEHLPAGAAAPSDPPVKSVPAGVSSTLSDPEPENAGADPVSVEGEEANDEDEDGDEDDLFGG